MTKFILVRHGQTEWNRIERFRGRFDVPLNTAGIQQAQITGRRIAAQWQPVAVYSSPLLRALKTAEAIAQPFQLPVQPVTDLIDIDYGFWQGLSNDEVSVHWQTELEAWYNAPHTLSIPGGESLADLRNRAMKAIHWLADHHEDETIVLVGHTVINRVILLAVMGLGNERFWRVHQDTCAINVFDKEGDDFTMITLNDTCHLAFANLFQ